MNVSNFIENFKSTLIIANSTLYMEKHRTPIIIQKKPDKAVNSNFVPKVEKKFIFDDVYFRAVYLRETSDGFKSIKPPMIIVFKKSESSDEYVKFKEIYGCISNMNEIINVSAGCGAGLIKNKSRFTEIKRIPKFRKRFIKYIDYLNDYEKLLEIGHAIRLDYDCGLGGYRWIEH